MRVCEVFEHWVCWDLICSSSSLDFSQSELLLYVQVHTVCEGVSVLPSLSPPVISLRTSSRCLPGSVISALCAWVWRHRWPGRSPVSRARRLGGSSWGFQIAPVLLEKAERKGQMEKFIQRRSEVLPAIAASVMMRRTSFSTWELLQSSSQVPLSSICFAKVINCFWLGTTKLIT